MRRTIQELTEQSSLLHPDQTQRKILQAGVGNYAEAFLTALDTAPAYVGDHAGVALQESPITEHGDELETVLELIGAEIDTPGVNCASGRHFGFIPPGGLYHSALGDFLAAVTNRYSGVSFASPGAARLERYLVEWIARLISYPQSAGGDLTSGGSIANLIGIVAAREAFELKAADLPNMVVYLSGQAHHSVAKALGILGLKECVHRHVPVDERFRLDADALERAVAEDRDAGLRPWLIVATAGSTDVGAVDPLACIADIAERHGMWLHVDAAYGGFFVLCEDGRKILLGMNRSDSIVLDPHKSLFLPFGSGAAIVKDKSLLLKAYHYEAPYLQDAQEAGVEPSPADVSPELTRPFRGLRLWLPLKLLGLAPFRAALQEKLLLARYFHAELDKLPGFAVGPAPDLSVVAFRYVPERGDADEFNRRLVQEILKEGRIFLSTTRLNGAFVLRLAILACRTHLDAVDLALDVLRRKAEQLTRQ